MPKLDWIGKEAVVEHHRDVPYRLVHCNGKLSAGDAEAGNLLVQGDNLEALKALLPFYAGKVKCVYIDPPYNTGNENWAYNDKVNHPKIRRWLGKIVGKESDDMCRHDKWLCMMYPRLRLLRDFLRPDGVIFASIDDNENHHLRLLMDAVFGPANFRNCFSVRRYDKNISRQFMDNGLFSFAVGAEYILAYARSNAFSFAPIMRAPASGLRERGYWKGFWNAAPRPTMRYELLGVTPDSGQWKRKESFARQAVSDYEEYMQKHSDITLEEHWEATGCKKSFIRRRKNLTKGMNKGVELWIPPNAGVLISSQWDDLLASDRGLKKHGIEFDAPKNIHIIKRLLASATTPADIVLDSFAGSGTTGHAVLSLNKEDGGDRRFVLVEMDDKICRETTARRLQTVIDGDAKIEKLDGGFRFCELGKPLFDANGGIAKDVKFADFANHIFFSETGSPIPKRASGKTPFLGVFRGRAYYLLRNGARGGALTAAVLDALPTPPDAAERVIFGDNCRLSEARLKREKAVFRQIPYEIKIR